MKKTLFYHLLLFIANLIYALNYSIAKLIMPEHIKPSGFVLLRVTGALVLYSISYFILVKERIDKSDLVRFFLCGIFGVAINQLLFFEGDPCDTTYSDRAGKYQHQPEKVTLARV